MTDLLLPRTDAGVLFQFIAATLVFIAVTWRFRGNKDARVFVVGLWVLTYGLMGVRAIH
jgi:hypothetical protein